MTKIRPSSPGTWHIAAGSGVAVGVGVDVGVGEGNGVLVDVGERVTVGVGGGEDVTATIGVAVAGETVTPAVGLLAHAVAVNTIIHKISITLVISFERSVIFHSLFFQSTYHLLKTTQNFLGSISINSVARRIL